MNRRTLAFAVVTLLVALGVVLSASRVLAPTFGPMVMVEAFAPYAVLLYAVALVLLLVLRGRGLTRLGPVLVLLLALHVGWLAPQFRGERAAKSPDSFTLMTANVMLGKGDPASVMRAVVAQDVDILVLEEVRPWQYLALQQQGIDVAFPHRTLAGAQELKGTVVFSRYALRDEVVLDVSQGAQRVTVAVPRGPVTLLGVHPARAFAGGSAQWAADHRSIEAAAREVDGPGIVAGDLNASSDHAPVRRLRELSFRDTAEVIGAGWQPTWPSDGQVAVLGVPVPPLFRIDHVLVNRWGSVVDSRTVAISGTDHRAVVAELVVRPRT